MLLDSDEWFAKVAQIPVYNLESSTWKKWRKQQTREGWES